MANKVEKELRRLLLGWYEQNGRDLPWRVKGGAHPDPYVILVSELMLQQTTVKTVPFYGTISDNSGFGGGIFG